MLINSKKLVLEDLKKVDMMSNLKKFERVPAILIETNVDELGQGFNMGTDSR